MKTTITREYWFAAAHRLEGHPKCGRLHGHNYRVVVELTGEPGPDGMVLDYGQMDFLLKPVIDALDHRYLVSKSNLDCACPYVDAAEREGHTFMLSTDASTAECIAALLWDLCRGKLSAGGYEFTSMCIQVDETPKSTACVCLPWFGSGHRA